MDVSKINAGISSYSSSGSVKPEVDGIQPKKHRSQEQLRQDRVELSKKAIEQVQAALAKKDAEKQKRDTNTLSAMMQSSREQAEDQVKPMNQLMKCLKIASRITNGDIVPLKDESYLMEHQMDMYMRAIMLRRVKEDPEEHKSILDDEDKEDSTTTPTAQASAPSAFPSVAVSMPEAPPTEGAE